MSPRTSIKAPARLLNIHKCPDVFKALLFNAHVIAEDLKEHYLDEMNNLAGKIKEIIKTGEIGKHSVLDGKEPIGKTGEMLKVLRGERLASACAS